MSPWANNLCWAMFLGATINFCVPCIFFGLTQVIIIILTKHFSFLYYSHNYRCHLQTRRTGQLHVSQDNLLARNSSKQSIKEALQCLSHRLLIEINMDRPIGNNFHYCTDLIVGTICGGLFPTRMWSDLPLSAQRSAGDNVWGTYSSLHIYCNCFIAVHIRW